MFDTKALKRALVFAAAFLMIRPGFGAPALTTIQDVLYRADGSRFEGTIYLAWTNFQAGDSTIVPSQSITVRVVNGVFRAQLIPTTTASAGAKYTVQYSSLGKFLFSETWAVPPSAMPLRVRDVRVATGAVVGPGPVNSPILVSDVVGLTSELSSRVSKGSGFAPSRAAVINTSGQLDAAGGNLGDCIRVDGSSGPCGTGSGTQGAGFAAFVDNETPTGIVDGSNLAFSLQFAPMPAASLLIFRNGIRLRLAVDYALDGTALTFATGAAPQPGDVLVASYRVGDPSNPLASYAAPQVVCSSTGAVTSAGAPAALGSCTFSPNVLKAGDRVEIRYDYHHQGTSSGFTVQVAWGASTILSRSASASESLLSGRSAVGLHASGGQWTSESWGKSTAFTVSSENAPDDPAQSIQIRFLGHLAAGGSDSLTLRNFTVLRYPAQSNP